MTFDLKYTTVNLEIDEEPNERIKAVLNVLDESSPEDNAFLLDAVLSGLSIARFGKKI